MAPIRNVFEMLFPKQRNNCHCQHCFASTIICLTPALTSSAPLWMSLTCPWGMRLHILGNKALISIQGLSDTIMLVRENARLMFTKHYYNWGDKMKAITKYSRTGKLGSMIECPNCHGRFTIYHFAGDSINCLHCDTCNHKSNWMLVCHNKQPINVLMDAEFYHEQMHKALKLIPDDTELPWPLSSFKLSTPVHYDWKH